MQIQSSLVFGIRIFRLGKLTSADRETSASPHKGPPYAPAFNSAVMARGVSGGSFIRAP